MNSINEKKRQDDVPLPLAVALLAVILGGLYYFKSPTSAAAAYQRWDEYFSAHAQFLTLIFVSLTLNFIWAWSVGSRWVGLSGQGQRLEALAGKKLGKEEPQDKRSLLRPTLLGSAAGLLSFALLYDLGPIPGWLSFETKVLIARIVTANFSLSGFVVGYMCAGLSVWKGFQSKETSELPPMPRAKNSVVIGTTGEDLGTPSWVTLSEHALRGNILITGSIGSGKTQGTILNYIEQILENFDPRPSIMMIDPKSTFIREARKLISERGLDPEALHMRLGGEVRYNPIYEPNALKNARFADTAHMIRAAASNYMSTSDSKRDFWEIESYNLIRNCLVYCAATKPYYTLTDLMMALVAAGSESTYSNLEKVGESGSFDEEERFNIECAIKYFRDEYAQLEDKIRTSILATATSFLNQFQEYQAQRIFCPKQEEITIHSMHDVVDQGKILLFDVTSPALARSMGTLVKLRYQQSVLDLLTRPEGRAERRGAALIMDEYQDVVTTGGGAVLGDDSYSAKAREAGGMMIAATPSLSSLENAMGSGKAAFELFQSFRTRLAGHSSDLRTIRLYQELAGQKEVERASHSISETSQRPNRNLVLGGFESQEANLSESINVSEHKEHVVQANDFATLKTFECFALVYDGVATTFKRLFWKPYYLKNKRVSHMDVLKTLPASIAAAAMACSLLIVPQLAYSFPSVCSVVRSSDFNSCLGLSVGTCMCGWPTPRPCAHISYYVPQTFIEVMPDPKATYFGALPGTALQLSTLGSLKVPFGAESDTDTQSFHAHAIAVPFASIPFGILPCGGERIERTCFDGMSEHVGSSWSTGSSDLLQPQFLAWSLSPKACLIKGAAMSATGGEITFSPETPACSVPLGWLPKFPPSQHSACNGWGTFYPRTGSYNGPSQAAGALMVASRMKSLSSEVFASTPSATDELWQMINPQTSSCFREGQNVGLLEIAKGVREEQRLIKGRLKGYLFVVWSKVSCCRDLVEVPAVYAAVGALSAACAGIPE